MAFDKVKASLEADKKYKTGKIREQNYLVILDAAETLFAEHGFKGASMMSIANEAGLPKANIHYYFNKKATLYSAVLERTMNEWNSGLDDISVEDDPKEVLGLYIEHKVRLAVAKPQSSKLFAREIISGAPYLTQNIAQGTRPWLRSRVEIFDAWSAQGKMRAVNGEKLIYLIWSTTEHYANAQAQVLLIRDEESYSDQDIQDMIDFIQGAVFSICGIE